LEIERRIRIILIHDLTDATERAHSASEAFEAIVAFLNISKSSAGAGFELRAGVRE